MKLQILAVGKCGRSPEQDIIDRYTTRLAWPLNIREVEERRPIKGQERMESEADKLLSAIPDGAFVIALDERGKNIKSQEMAKKFSDLQNQSRSDITFIIGGADGLSPRIRERADMLLSFGVMTWPHMMVRAMLLEQIYRAWSILAGHPYHKE